MSIENITIEVQEGEDQTIEVNENLSIPEASAPTNWADLVALIGRGYSYPQPTGQTTSYRAGDDADIEATIFTAAVRAANSLKAHNSLANFTTLNNTNSFGNTNRFTDDAGGQTYANDYVIDHYTGLGWYRVLQGTNNWNDSIDNCVASTQNGFSDWFLESYTQLVTILNTSGRPLNYTPFSLSSGFKIKISTTVYDTTTKSFLMREDVASFRGIVTTEDKTTSSNYLLCRRHF